MKLDKIIAVRSNKTVYRDGDKCIKVFNSEYSKADVLNEALNQARIELEGITIPKVLEVTMVDGKWAIVSEYIKGKTLAQLMAQDEDNKAKYVELLVDLQIGVHQHTCAHLSKLKDKMSRKIAETDFDATTRYDLHTRLESMPKHNKVCHGDFNPTNIIITPEGKAYIVDWAHATQGNASADVARTYLLFCLNGDEATAKLYLDIFCKKSNTEKQYVKKWMPIVAASQAVNCDDKEFEFLMGWVIGAEPQY